MDDDNLDVALADRDDAVPEDFLDAIVAEYQRNIVFDGLSVMAVAEG